METVEKQTKTGLKCPRTGGRAKSGESDLVDSVKSSNWDRLDGSGGVVDMVAGSTDVDKPASK